MEASSDSYADAKLRSQLFGLLRPISHLGQVAGLLEWDQETVMPRAGAEGRAEQLETLADLRHRLLVSEELWRTLQSASRSDDPELQLHAERALREVVRARRTPAELVSRLAGTRSRAVARWQQARAAADFSRFAGVLSELVELRKEQAEHIASGDTSGLDRNAATAPDRVTGPDPYSVLLEEYEADIECSLIDALFDPLLDALVSLVEEAQSHPGRSAHLDEPPNTCAYPADAQLRLGRMALEAIGFDSDSGRIDLSTHPFCMGIHPQDVRITWRVDPNDFRPGLFGLLHEMGHALYEQGLPLEHRNTPLGAFSSMALHESQSRLWENHVGRSLGFCQWLAPHFHTIFPQSPLRAPEALRDHLTIIRPSLIRVDADELTYHLHILVRYRLERDLIAGRLSVSDLPEAWNQAYRQALGLTPRNDAEGVLQDIHWACGLFGYFPTYTLGSLIAAQLFEAAERDLGSLDPRFRAGEFSPLLDWLRERIHRIGSKLLTLEIVESATGEGLSIQPFLRHAAQLVTVHERVSA